MKDYIPTFGLSNAAIAYAIDLANGDVDDEREIVAVEFKDVCSTHDRPLPPTINEMMKNKNSINLLTK